MLLLVEVERLPAQAGPWLGRQGVAREQRVALPPIEREVPWRMSRRMKDFERADTITFSDEGIDLTWRMGSEPESQA